MSQFPGDKSSEFLAGTLGGPGYGEFPLGSAGPRVDPRDPRYIPPPQPGSGGNFLTPPVNPFDNPLFSDPGLGGGQKGMPPIQKREDLQPSIQEYQAIT